jgi:two-component system, LytTR family, sensor kinase
MSQTPKTEHQIHVWVVKPAAQVCLWMGLWGVLGCAFATQLYLNSAFFGNSISWKQAILWSMTDWLLWGFLSLPVWWLAARVRFHKDIFKRAVTIHLAAGIFTSISYVLIRFWMAQIQFQSQEMVMPFETTFVPLLLKSFPVNMLVYAMIVITCHGVYYYRAMHAKELNESRLEEHLQEARLMALQMQLNPHFLFNTLHAISTLIYRCQQDAERMLILLSDLLRHALEHTDRPMLPLQQEIEFLQHYLDIEKLRLGDRLRISMDIEPSTLQKRVPTLMLQPLVENTVIYAVEPYERPCHVEISATQKDQTLVITIKDDGPGLKDGQPVKFGVGLGNVYKRLNELYGSKHTFICQNRAEGGFCVNIRIPAES